MSRDAALPKTGMSINVKVAEFVRKLRKNQVKLISTEDFDDRIIKIS